MLSLKSIKPLLAFVLLGVGSAWMGCSDSAPVASRPAGKATCSLCKFLGDDTYTATDGLPAPESPDTTQTDANADSTQTDADADSTQSATVEFADANLERAVREALDRPQGPLTPADLASLTELDASYKNIQSLAGLEHATALTTLYLRGNAITDVSPLASLTNLQSLSLWGNEVTDVSPLAGLINLQKLSLWGNEITDVQPLAGLINLQWLQLGDNAIADISPLASLTNLQWLGVMENALSQHAANQQLAAAITSGLRVVAVIEKYPRVETVQVYPEEPEPEEPEPELDPNRPIVFLDATLAARVRVAVCLLPSELRPDCPSSDSITPAHVASLTQLNLVSRGITDLTGLERVTALDTLYLTNNSITDVSPLGSLTNLKLLNIRNNQIMNVQPLGSLTSLEWLNLRNNQIVNVQPLGSLTSLKLLNLEANQIVNVQPLGSLTNLTYISLKDNEVVDLSPLLPLAQAQRSNIEIILNGNPLSQASKNTAAGMNNLGAVVRIDM